MRHESLKTFIGKLKFFGFAFPTWLNSVMPEPVSQHTDYILFTSGTHWIDQLIIFSVHFLAANSNYELGRGDKLGGWKPQPVPSLKDVHIIQIASGGYHSLALTGMDTQNLLALVEYGFKNVYL